MSTDPDFALLVRPSGTKLVRLVVTRDGQPVDVTGRRLVFSVFRLRDRSPVITPKSILGAGAVTGFLLTADDTESIYAAAQAQALGCEFYFDLGGKETSPIGVGAIIVAVRSAQATGSGAGRPAEDAITLALDAQAVDFVGSGIPGRDAWETAGADDAASYDQELRAVAASSGAAAGSSAGAQAGAGAVQPSIDAANTKIAQTETARQGAVTATTAATQKIADTEAARQASLTATAQANTARDQANTARDAANLAATTVDAKIAARVRGVTRDIAQASVIRLGNGAWPSWTNDPTFPGTLVSIARTDGYSLVRAAFTDMIGIARASVATYRNSTGALISAANDTPRLAYRYVAASSSWVLSGLAVEPQVTNLLLQSTDLTQTAWAKTGLTASAGALVESNALATHAVTQTVTGAVASGATYTKSAIMSEQPGSAKRYPLLYFAGSPFGGTVGATFDLAAGIFRVTTARVTAAISPLGNGLWMCSITVAATAAGDLLSGIRLCPDLVPAMTYQGDGTSGVNVSELQVELGAGLTSRIRSGASAGTRAPDQYTKGLGVEFNPASHSALMTWRFTALPATGARLWQVDDATSANRVTCRIEAGAIIAEAVVGGVVQATVVGPVVTTSTDYRVAIGFAAGQLALAVNGTDYTPATPAALPSSFTMRRWGCDAAGGNQPAGHILPYLQDASEYARLLSSAERQTYTA